MSADNTADVSSLPLAAPTSRRAPPASLAATSPLFGSILASEIRRAVCSHPPRLPTGSAKRGPCERTCRASCTIALTPAPSLPVSQVRIASSASR